LLIIAFALVLTIKFPQHADEMKVKARKHPSTIEGGE
jgi:hypothetical protein